MAPKDYNTQDCPTPGPGPGAYLLPPTIGYDAHDYSRWRGPAFSLGKRVSQRIRSDTPGPIYNVRGLNRYGPEGAQNGYTINSRVKYSKKSLVPGPGTYQPEKFPYPKAQNAPAFSLIGRGSTRAKFTGPGPNQYALPPTVGWNVPNMKSAPAARILGKLKGKFKTDSPGPASYGIPNYDAILTIFPATTMGARVMMDPKSKSPGPLAYYPTYRCGRTPPSFSIRSRVGRCVKPYITPLDACD